MIENAANAHKAQEPERKGRVCAIHKNVDSTLDVLITSFGEILMLMTRFRLPVSHVTIATNVADTGADEIIGIVRNEPCRCFPFDNHVSKSARKFEGRMHFDDISDLEDEA